MAGLDDETLRAARNQSLYRDVNERIQDLNEAFDDVLAFTGEWVCECADESCTTPMEMSLAEYEKLRSHPNNFAVLPGHVYDKVEVVVEDHERYVVVQKIGKGAEYAVEHDPRAEDK
jgi:hypothetical protein